MSEPRLKKVIHAHTPEQRRAEPLRLEPAPGDFVEGDDGAMFVIPEQRLAEPLTADIIWRLVPDSMPELAEALCTSLATLDAERATPDPRVEQLEAALDAAARHIEPHVCGRDGPWSACDFNRVRALLRSPQERSGE